MSTRSLTRVNEDGAKILNMYRHCDGYPSAHGLELYEFLKDLRMTAGLGLETKNTANGACCLAAQLVAHFKKEPGGFYLQPVTAKDCDQDFEYTIEVSGLELNIKAKESGRRGLFFDGSVTAFGAWCRAQRE